MREDRKKDGSPRQGETRCHHRGEGDGRGTSQGPNRSGTETDVSKD